MASSNWYAMGVKNLNMGNCSWKTGETYKIALLNGLYYPDRDTHALWSDISSYETSGVGYAALPLVINDPVYNADTNTLWYGAADVIWDNANNDISARYAVIYADGGTPETQYLIGYLDFGEVKIAQSIPFELRFATVGLFRQRIA